MPQPSNVFLVGANALSFKYVGRTKDTHYVGKSAEWYNSGDNITATPATGVDTSAPTNTLLATLNRVDGPYQPTLINVTTSTTLTTTDPVNTLIATLEIVY